MSRFSVYLDEERLQSLKVYATGFLPPNIADTLPACVHGFPRANSFKDLDVSDRILCCACALC